MYIHNFILHTIFMINFGTYTNFSMQDSRELSRLLHSWELQRARESESESGWTREDRLRKSAQDLVDTERDYVKVSQLTYRTFGYMYTYTCEDFSKPLMRLIM